MNYLEDVNNKLVYIIENMPNKLNKLNKVYDYTDFNNLTFEPNTLYYFIEYISTNDRALNNERVVTPFFIHVAIMTENGAGAMRVAPQMLKDNLIGYKEEFIDSILIGKVGNYYFDKQKTIWRNYIVGEIYWNRNK